MTDKSPRLDDIDVQPEDVPELAAQPPVPTGEMFHGLLGEIVAAAEPSTEADSVGVLVSLIAGSGAVIGAGSYVRIGNTIHPLLIWPLLFGRTGSGRKGEAGETSGMFLRRASQVYQGIAVTGLSSGEGLIERIRDPDPDNEKDTGGTSDKRLAVTEPEFASVMARAKREGSTLAYVLREAWSGKPLSVMNRRALHASSSHVAIVGHITPKEFRLRLAEADMAGGTFNRFLPVYVERSKKLPIPLGVDYATQDRLGSLLQDAIQRGREIGEIGLSDEAKQLWTAELYDEFTEADDEDALWTEFARRAAPYCRRIAAMYAAMDGRNLVGKDDLAAAAALVRYSVDSAKYVLDGRRRDPRMDRLMRAIDAAGTKGLSRAEISALFSRKLSTQVLAELLAALVETGRYELVRIPTSGRPAEVYRMAKQAKEAR